MIHIGLLLCCCAAGLLHACGKPSASLPEKPHIIIIMADDMGFSDIGPYGGEIHTPVLDRLAAGGLRFSQFYNTARCCPTRGSLLTGLYPHQAGLGAMVSPGDRRGYEGRLMDRCVTIAEALQPAGYRTGMVGKWHVSPFDYPADTPQMPDTWPLQRGFEYFYGTIAGGGSYYFPPGLMVGNTPAAPEGDGYYYTNAISDSAGAFIRRSADDPRPFFLYVAYTAPHWPLHALEEDIARYRGRYAAGWEALRRERHQRQVSLGLISPDWRLSDRAPDAVAWEAAGDQAWQAERMAVYAAQIDRVDQGIGRIVRALEEIDALDHTLLLFLADNGGCNEVLNTEPWGTTTTTMRHAAGTGQPVVIGNVPGVMPGPWNTFQSYGQSWANASNTPFRLYKKWNHEGGISTPLIAHWPAVIRNGGAVTHEPGHVIDLMATCVDAGGGVYPASHRGHDILPLEGKSLVPIFQTGRRDGHEYLYWEHLGNRAVRGGDWKLVMEKGGAWELYNLRSDRTETQNLIGVHPDKARELETAWNAWAGRAYVIE